MYCPLNHSLGGYCRRVTRPVCAPHQTVEGQSNCLSTETHWTARVVLSMLFMLCWTTCVQDSRIAVVCRALALLTSLTQLAGGQFMSRRVQQEALPIMQQLLKQGPPQAIDHSAGEEMSNLLLQAPLCG